MMRHTSYGKLPGRFEGSGWRLFLRGLPLWLASLGPLLVAAGLWPRRSTGRLSTPSILKMPKMARLPSLAPISSEVRHQDAHRPSASAGSAGSVLVAILLYPVFQAIVYRWWLSGLRFGGIAVTSRLRIGQVYVIYLRYIGSCLVVHDGSFHRHRRSVLRHLRAVERRPYSEQPDTRPRRDRGRDRYFVLCRLCARDFGHASGSDHVRTCGARPRNRPRFRMRRFWTPSRPKRALAPRSAKAWSMHSVSGVSEP